jgi:hypothetical protein
MALDTSAAQSAQSLLNGIDYAALIGGPLEAAIKAQAMAALSTWEFIQNVGLQKKSDGRIEAVNVTFTYQKDGKLVRLIVPILTIVPIPLIVIDDVSIAFKANINASASQTQEDSSSENVAAEASAEAKIGWGPFSLTAKFQASYSSKKDSKATQDSRYSVEYTQDVSVHATQAGMPAGLATVLNILSNAATDAPISGAVTYSPQVGSLNLADPSKTQPVTVVVVQSDAIKPADHPITITAGKAEYTDALSLKRLPLGEDLGWTDGKITVNTDGNGQVGIAVSLDPSKAGELPSDGIIALNFESQVDEKPRTAQFRIKVTGQPLPGPTSVDFSPSEVSVKNDDKPAVSIAVKIDENGKPVTGKSAKVAFSKAVQGVSATAAGTAITPDGVDAAITDGKFEIASLKADSTAQAGTFNIVVSYGGVTKSLPVTVTA